MFMVSNGVGVLEKPHPGSTKRYFIENILHGDLKKFDTIEEILKIPEVWKSSNECMVVEMSFSEFGKKVFSTAPAICFISKEGAKFTPLGIIKYGFPPYLPNPFV